MALSAGQENSLNNLSSLMSKAGASLGGELGAAFSRGSTLIGSGGGQLKARGDYTQAPPGVNDALWNSGVYNKLGKSAGADFTIAPAAPAPTNGSLGDVDHKGQELAAAQPSSKVSTDWWNYPAHSADQAQALKNAQDLQSLIQAQATYHHEAMDTGLPQPHSTFEYAADLAAVIQATGYGVTGKSLANLQANADASSVLMSPDASINPILMNQAEYVRQVSANPTAYGAVQPFAANAYFGQGIATTVADAVAGVARSLGITPQQAASFSGVTGGSTIPGTGQMGAGAPTTPDPLNGPIDPTAYGGGGGSGGSTGLAQDAGTNWGNLLVTFALPLVLIGLFLYLIWTSLSGSSHQHVSRSNA